MNETKDNIENNICLITKEQLEDNFIKLSCKHTFNYEAILFDTIYQKKWNNLETQKLKKYEIKCPYCRTIQNGLLVWKQPYEKIKYINWPPSKWYKNNTCKFTYSKLIVNFVENQCLRCKSCRFFVNFNLQNLQIVNYFFEDFSFSFCSRIMFNFCVKRNMSLSNILILSIRPINVLFFSEPGSPTT